MYFYTDLQTRNPSASQINIILKTKEVINSDFSEEAGTKNNLRFFNGFLKYLKKINWVCKYNRKLNLLC